MNNYVSEADLGSVLAELTKIRESTTDLLNLVDMTDSTTFNKEDGISSQSSGPVFSFSSAYGQALSRPSSTACAYISETQLRMIRARSRAFCSMNPYWHAVRENKINYVVGTGHVLSIGPRERGETLEDGLKRKVVKELKDFQKKNQYRRRQGEKLTRLDRDGEYILRFHDDDDDGILRVRFVEPILLQDPPGRSAVDNVWFGILFDGDDYEQAVRYYIRSSSYDGLQTAPQIASWREGVPAEEIQHRKANVDLGSPRGIPTTYWLQDTCTQALSTLKSMGRLVDIRARIAVVRKQVNGTLAAIQPLLARQRVGTFTDAGGNSRNAFLYGYGSIVDTNDQRSLEFPSQHIETDKIVASLKADLQAVSAVMGLADFTISGDSSAAFANALVKEGPMDRAVGRMQQDMIEDDIEVYERALTVAADNGRLPDDVLEKVAIDVMPPGVIARDRLVNTQADEILVRMGAMSPDTMSLRANLDPDDERRKAEEHPSPEQQMAQQQLDADVQMAKMQGMGRGNTRSNQAGGGGKTTARGVPAGKEPGPKANNRATKREDLEEGSYEPHCHDCPTKAELDMASVWITPEWLAGVKGEILGLPNTGGPPKNQNPGTQYETGVRGMYLGKVDDQAIWAVDTAAVMVKHDAPDFVVAGNHMRWEWIMPSTILVDWSYAPSDMQHNLLHEIVETRLMDAGRWGYALAHKLANHFERKWLLELRPELQSLTPEE